MNLKRIIIPIVLIATTLFSTSFADVKSDATLRNEATYIKVEYEKAIKNKDLQKQTQLLREAKEFLKRDMNKYQKTITPTIGIMSEYDPGLAAYYTKYFSNSLWITRDGVISLSLYPKKALTSSWNSSPAKAEAWEAVQYKHSSSSKWRNTSVMKEQFYCHYWFASSIKSPWNLEPHRTSINPITCN